MDITEALRHTENALRDFVAFALQAKYGDDWEHKSNIDLNTVRKWEGAKRREENKQKNGVVEPRLIYYADFYDLYPIIKDNWMGTFQPVFDTDHPTMKVWLEALRTVRNQEAHGREILEHQKYMALGSSGEIRTRLIRYRSKMETAEDYFPRIERVNDDLGNVWVAGSEQPVKALNILHPGDVITFTVIASDPQGFEPEYCIVSPTRSYLNWQKSNILPIEITNVDIMRNCNIAVYIRSTSGNYHANGDWDENAAFHFTVLPKK